MSSDKQESRREDAERIARHYLDSERVSVIQFSDTVTAIEAALKKRDDRIDRLSKAIRHAVDDLRSDHVLPNLFRLGLLGKQDVERAIEGLNAVIRTKEPHA